LKGSKKKGASPFSRPPPKGMVPTFLTALMLNFIYRINAHQRLQCTAALYSVGSPPWNKMDSGETAVALLRAFRDLSELTTPHHCGPSSSRVVSLPLEVLLPNPSAPLVRRPHLAVHPLRGVQIRATQPFYWSSCLPRASTPLQSLTQQSLHGCARPLSRGSSPPQRNPIDDSHQSGPSTVPVVRRPHAYHAPRRFFPSSISPVSFNRARSRGSPFRA
jgi:hypothetical protein